MSERYRELWEKAELGKVDGTTPTNPHFWSYFKRRSHLLEVGIGWGRVALECLKRGLDVTGIDINAAEVINLSRKLQPANSIANLVIGDVTELPLRSNIFDGALLQGLLSALNINNRTKGLEEVRRVIKDDGIIHIAEFQLIENDNSATRRYLQDMAATGEYGTLSVKDNSGTEMFRTHNFRKTEIHSLLTKTGFEVISLEENLFRTFKGKLKPGIMIISRKIA